jgi:hypothetical protein
MRGACQRPASLEEDRHRSLRWSFAGSSRRVSRPAFPKRNRWDRGPLLWCRSMWLFLHGFSSDGTFGTGTGPVAGPIFAAPSACFHEVFRNGTDGTDENAYPPDLRLFRRAGSTVRGLATQALSQGLSLPFTSRSMRNRRALPPFNGSRRPRPERLRPSDPRRILPQVFRMERGLPDCERGGPPAVSTTPRRANRR